MYKKTRHGLTVIELLLVIGIVAIVGAASTPFLSNFVLRNSFETTIDKVVGTIRKAQNYSMSSKNAWVWGVCLNGNTLKLFGGSGTPTCVTNDFVESFQIPGSVSIVGLDETTFSPLRGEPSAILSITVSTTIDMATITLNAAGGMEQT